MKARIKNEDAHSVTLEVTDEPDATKVDADYCFRTAARILGTNDRKQWNYVSSTGGIGHSELEMVPDYQKAGIWIALGTALSEHKARQ